jgi:hypothetical protein
MGTCQHNQTVGDTGKRNKKPLRLNAAAL